MAAFLFPWQLFSLLGRGRISGDRKDRVCRRHEPVAIRAYQPLAIVMCVASGRADLLGAPAAARSPVALRLSRTRGPSPYPNLPMSPKPDPSPSRPLSRRAAQKLKRQSGEREERGKGECKGDCAATASACRQRKAPRRGQRERGTRANKSSLAKVALPHTFLGMFGLAGGWWGCAVAGCSGRWCSPCLSLSAELLLPSDALHSPLHIVCWLAVRLPPASDPTLKSFGVQSRQQSAPLCSLCCRSRRLCGQTPPLRHQT